MKRKDNPLEDISLVRSRLAKKCKIFPQETLIGNLVLSKFFGDDIPSIQPPRIVDENYQDQVRTFMRQWNEMKSIYGNKNGDSFKKIKGREYECSVDGEIMESDSDGENERCKINKANHKQNINTVKRMKRKENAKTIEQMRENLPINLKPFDESVLINNEPSIQNNVSEKGSIGDEIAKIPLSIQPYFSHYEKGQQLMKNMRDNVESNGHIMDVVMEAFQNGLHKTSTNTIHLSFVLSILQNNPKMWIPNTPAYFSKKLLESMDQHDRNKRFNLLTPPFLPYHRPCLNKENCVGLTCMSHLPGYFSPRESLTDKEELEAMQTGKPPDVVKPCQLCMDNAEEFFYINTRAECKNLAPRTCMNKSYNPVNVDGEYHISQTYMSTSKQYQHTQLPRLYFIPAYYTIVKDESGIPHYNDDGYIDPEKLRDIEKHKLFR